MATARLYLDKRSRKLDGTYPIRVTISHSGQTARITLNVSVRADQWNATTGRVCQHPNRGYLNAYLLQELTSIGNALMALQQSGALKCCTATEVKAKVVAYLHPEDVPHVTFGTWYDKFARMHENARTRAIYEAT